MRQSTLGAHRMAFTKSIQVTSSFVLTSWHFTAHFNRVPFVWSAALSKKGSNTIYIIFYLRAVRSIWKQLLISNPIPSCKQFGQRLATALTPSKRKCLSLPPLAQDILFRLRYQYISEEQKPNKRRVTKYLTRRIIEITHLVYCTALHKTR